MVALLKSGAEFLVNTTTSGAQFSSRVTALAGGGYVVVWVDESQTGADLSGAAVRAQIYSAAGAKIGGEFVVNTTKVGAQTAPDVAALAGGGFVATWQDASATGGDTSSDAVRAQVFDPTGIKIGAEQLVKFRSINPESPQKHGQPAQLPAVHAAYHKLGLRDIAIRGDQPVIDRGRPRRERERQHEQPQAIPVPDAPHEADTTRAPSRDCACQLPLLHVGYRSCAAPNRAIVVNLRYKAKDGNVRLCDAK